MFLALPVPKIINAIFGILEENSFLSRVQTFQEKFHISFSTSDEVWDKRLNYTAQQKFPNSSLKDPYYNIHIL